VVTAQQVPVPDKPMPSQHRRQNYPDVKRLKRHNRFHNFRNNDNFPTVENYLINLK
jgi:hypothetical protein